MTAKANDAVQAVAGDAEKQTGIENIVNEVYEAFTAGVDEGKFLADMKVGFDEAMNNLEGNFPV